jgi:hypothetical protein
MLLTTYHICAFITLTLYIVHATQATLYIVASRGHADAAHMCNT